MAKRKEIASTGQLLDYRRKLSRRAGWWGFFWALVVVIVYFAYVFLAVAPQGYGAEPAFDWAVSWKFKLPYFDTTIPLTSIWDYTVVLRWVILLLVLVVAIVIGAVVYKLLLSSYTAKTVITHDKALGNLLRSAYGIESHFIPGKGYADESDVIQLTNIDKAQKDFTILLADQVISFDVSQYTYSYEGEECQGVLAVTELVNTKVDGFIQLRTFGAPDGGIVDDKIVLHHDIKDPRIDRDYAVYSTLDREEVKAFLTPEVVTQLVKLRRLVEGGIVLTVHRHTLSILFDGMQLSVGKDLKQDLPSGYLERQGQAVKALFDIYESLVKESTFAPDEATPEVQPLGEEAPLIKKAA